MIIFSDKDEEVLQQFPSTSSSSSSSSSSTTTSQMSSSLKQSSSSSSSSSSPPLPSSMNRHQQVMVGGNELQQHHLCTTNLNHQQVDLNLNNHNRLSVSPVPYSYPNAFNSNATNNNNNNNNNDNNIKSNKSTTLYMVEKNGKKSKKKKSLLGSKKKKKSNIVNGQTILNNHNNRSIDTTTTTPSTSNTNNNNHTGSTNLDESLSKVKKASGSWYEEDPQDNHHFNVKIFPDKPIYFAGETIEVHVDVYVKKLQILNATLQGIANCKDRHHTISNNTNIVGGVRSLNDEDDDIGNSSSIIPPTLRETIISTDYHLYPSASSPSASSDLIGQPSIQSAIGVPDQQEPLSQVSSLLIGSLDKTRARSHGSLPLPVPSTKLYYDNVNSLQQQEQKQPQPQQQLHPQLQPNPHDIKEINPLLKTNIIYVENNNNNPLQQTQQPQQQEDNISNIRRSKSSGSLPFLINYVQDYNTYYDDDILKQMCEYLEPLQIDISKTVSSALSVSTSTLPKPTMTPGFNESIEGAEIPVMKKSNIDLIKASSHSDGTIITKRSMASSSNASSSSSSSSNLIIPHCEHQYHQPTSKHHQFKFEVNLPQNLPPSFSFKKDSKTGVFYRLNFTGLGDCYSGNKMLLHNKKDSKVFLKGLETSFPLHIWNPSCLYLPKQVLLNSARLFGPSDACVSFNINDQQLSLPSMKARLLIRNFGIIGSSISIMLKIDNRNGKTKVKGFKVALINTQQIININNNNNYNNNNNNNINNSISNSNNNNNINNIANNINNNNNNNNDSNDEFIMATNDVAVSLIKYKSKDYGVDPGQRLQTNICFNLDKSLTPSVILGNLSNLYTLHITPITKGKSSKDTSLSSLDIPLLVLPSCPPSL